MQLSKQTTHLGPMHSQLQSPLFKLPAEIRTLIYEYAFVVVTDEDGEINIRSEVLPSINLPSTFRRIHQECVRLQRDVYNDFWDSRCHDFKLEITITREDLSTVELRDICRVSNEEFRCLRRLQVILALNLGCSETGARSRITLELYNSYGYWKSDITHKHEKFSDAAARREFSIKLHKLIQNEFDELQHYTRLALS